MIKTPNGLGVFAWKRLILTVTLLLVINGVFSWFNTPQEEDPQLSPRDGIVTVIFPGAIPRDMERLIAKPIEDELAQVDSIKTIVTRLRTDFMFMQIKLKDSLSSATETQNAWQKVQDALDRSEKKLPETARKPDLNTEIYDQDAVLLAVSGGESSLLLLDQVKVLKDRLQSIPTVKKIDFVASPGEQLSIVFDHAKLLRFGVSLENLVKQLRGGNASIPSGYVRVNEKKVSVLTNAFYRSSEELAHFPIVLKSGDTIPLSEIATISRTRVLPISESMRHNGKIATALGVVPKSSINLQKFGEQVREVIREFKNTDEFKRTALQIDEVSFQPHYVEERIFDIGLDLLKAIFLVGGVLMLMLGFRLGSIVAIQVPIVTAIAFGIFSNTGGVLNQISIAAFILAIGLLVDNVVVVVDGIQEKLDRGMTPIQAGETTRKEYMIPLAAGTLTTIAAFMPILMSKGTVADFTRAIGIVATIALLCSYIFCICVTPVVASNLLKKGKARQWLFVDPLGEKLGRWVDHYPKLIITSALTAVCLAVLGFTFVKKQFFPFADRDLVIVDLQLAEGTHYKTTEKAALKVEEEIRKDPRVTAVTTLIGRGVPPFYYNLPREPNSPHIAQFIVRTRNQVEAKAFKNEREHSLQEVVPFGTLMVKEIAQGPVVRAPIEVRIFSEDPKKLQEASEKALTAVRSASGVWKVRSTLGTGMMSYRLDVNDSASGNFGITRADVSGVILATTRGIPITTFRGGNDPYSITLMSEKGEEGQVKDIQNYYMGSTRTENLSVGTLTQGGFEFSPSVLEHRDRSSIVYVLGEIAPNSSENIANQNVKNRIAELPPIDGVKIQMGGTNAESADANKAMFLALPVGLFILLMSLLFEFNSFRRVGIILTTIPLCAVGAVPGLILSGSTFGFMTLLGFFTLAGTVIHNGIFLIDYIDHRMHDGIPINQAITEGIQRRTRPIILTAVATLVELLPMTLSSSTLWPPFAWAIISGLSVSTLMTLLVVPSIYKIAFEKKGTLAGVVTVSPIFLTFILSGILSAFWIAAPVAKADLQRVNLQDVIRRSKSAPETLIHENEAEKARHEADAVWRASFMPKLVGMGLYDRLNKPVGIVNPIPNPAMPFTSFTPSSQHFLLGRVELNQPLLDVSSMLYASPAAARLADAAKLKASHSTKDHQEKTIGYFFQILELRAKREALANYVKNLHRRKIEIRRIYELGGVSETDLLKVTLGVDDASQGILELQEKEEFLQILLAQALGEKDPLSPMELPETLPSSIILENKNRIASRLDLQALSKQVEGLELQGMAAQMTLIPRLEIFLGYTYFKQEILTSNHWADFGVRLTWPIFDGGIRNAKAAAFAAERESLNHRKQSAILALDAQETSARRILEIKHQEYLKRIKGLADAKRVSELDFKRLRHGKITVNQVIDTEDLLKDRQEKASTSKINWYREWFRYQASRGDEFSSPGL